MKFFSIKFVYKIVNFIQFHFDSFVSSCPDLFVCSVICLFACLESLKFNFVSKKYKLFASKVFFQLLETSAMWERLKVDNNAKLAKQMEKEGKLTIEDLVGGEMI